METQEYKCIKIPPTGAYDIPMLLLKCHKQLFHTVGIEKERQIPSWNTKWTVLILKGKQILSLAISHCSPFPYIKTRNQHLKPIFFICFHHKDCQTFKQWNWKSLSLISIWLFFPSFISSPLKSHPRYFHNLTHFALSQASKLQQWQNVMLQIWALF